MTDWEYISLSEMSDSCLGKMLDKEKNVGQLHPYLSNKNVRWGSFDLDNLNLMRFKESEFERYTLNEGDLVVCEGGEPGRCAIWKGQTSIMRIQKALHRVRVKKGFDPYFLYYRFLLAGKSNGLSNHFIGSTIKHLTGVRLKKMEFQFPDYKTQIKISSILSSLDSKIELNNKISAELEAMAKFIYDYWFVQFDFPNKNGKPYKSSGGKMVYNGELKREIPEGWNWAFVENLLAQDKRTKKIPTSEYLEKGPIPIIDQSTKFICAYTNNNEACIAAKVPRIVFGDHTRIVKLINFDFARGADGTQVLLSNSNNMPPHLFYHSLLKIDLSNYGYARHFKFLKQSKVLLPDLALAELFETQVKRYFDKIKHNIFENLKLEELRDWLLPMLMNGQITIGKPYNQEKENLGMVAEPGTTYQNDKEAINALFETINHDYETAVIQLLTDRRFGFTYGKKYTHKMFSNIEMLHTMPKFNDLVFEEKGWGMFSKAVAKTIDIQKFIYFHRLDSGAEVLKVRPNAYKKVMAWTVKEENKPFVTDVENMLTIYEKPLINKDMDRIELFNTVLECMKVLETDNLQAIRAKMAHWKMEEEYNKTKAEKFSENETLHMIGFVKTVL
mgnify:CR=1 FL=1